MLGRKKKFIEETNFAFDIFVAGGILASVNLLLINYHKDWEIFLQWITGFPFKIQQVAHLQNEFWLYAAILINLFISLKFNKFYQIDLFAKRFEIALQSFKCVAMGICLTALFFYFFTIFTFNRSILFGFALLFLVYHIIKELCLRKYLLNNYYVKNPLEAILICSAREAKQKIADVSERHLSNVRIKSIVLAAGEKETLEPELRKLCIGEIDDLSAILSKGRYDLVFLGEVKSNPKNAQTALVLAEEQGIEVWFFVDFLTSAIAQPTLDEYGGKPVIVYKTTSHREGEILAKRIFDLIVTSLGILIISPALITIAILVKLTSTGPIFFIQERTGFRGKTFKMFKFRTMISGAESRLKEIKDKNEMDGPVFKLENDPRITKIGKFLRRYSLDELPQLFNVIRGEMSLVGPRPLPVYETQNFEAFKDHRRYSVLPGLTGLWQISGRNTITDFSEWVRLDLEYIDTWSLWLDLGILCKTIPVILSGEGAK